jgi:hypothetical protein
MKSIRKKVDYLQLDQVAKHLRNTVHPKIMDESWKVVYNEAIDHARRVLRGEVDDSFK